VTLETELKQLFVRELKLTDIDPETVQDDDPLFVEGLGLDSLDALEVIRLVQKHYGVEIRDMDMGRSILTSVKTLADYIREHGKPA